MRRIPKGTQIQTILFDRHRWSPEQARKWIETHGYRGKAKQSSGQVLFYRFMQAPVYEFEKKSFRTIDLDPRYGVKAVVGLPKGGAFLRNPSPKKRIKNKRKSRVPTIAGGVSATSTGFKKGQAVRCSEKYYTYAGSKPKVPRNTIGHVEKVENDWIGVLWPKKQEVWFHPTKHLKVARQNPCTGVQSNPATTSIKIPSVLVCLGRAVELHDQTWGFRWAINAKMMLYTSAGSNVLYILKTEGIRADKSRLKAVEQRADVKAAMGVYERWSDFQSSSASVITQPQARFYRLGKAKVLVYESDKWTGKKTEYEHKFTASPLVYGNRKEKPTAIIIRGAKIAVTKEGIKG